jgi:hypothetical protein
MRIFLDRLPFLVEFNAERGAMLKAFVIIHGAPSG